MASAFGATQSHFSLSQIKLQKKIKQRARALIITTHVKLTLSRCGLQGSLCSPQPVWPDVNHQIVYKSCPKMISIGKWTIFTPLHELPNNVSDLSKMIVATGFEWLPYIWANFVRIFAAIKFQKSPNWVTLRPLHHRHPLLLDLSARICERYYHIPIGQNIGLETFFSPNDTFVYIQNGDNLSFHWCLREKKYFAQ